MKSLCLCIGQKKSLTLEKLVPREMGESFLRIICIGSWSAIKKKKAIKRGKGWNVCQNLLSEFAYLYTIAIE